MDPTSKMAGRGAYLHDRRECWERGLKGALANALKATLTADERAKLEEFMSALPQDVQSAQGTEEGAGTGPQNTGMRE